MRRVDGQPVEHGPTYLHGRGRRSLAELDGVGDATAIPDWPRAREGGGVWCRPEAFEGNDRRLAFTEGVSRLAKHLAGADGGSRGVVDEHVGCRGGRDS